MVNASFGPGGNDQWAKTPHKQLVEYVDNIKSGGGFRIAEATRLVHFATRHIGTRNVQFNENWLQWSLGQVYPPMLQTQELELLIAGKLGNCADRCQILKSVVEQSGRRCRFVGLSGHVVLEIEMNNAWCVADPDYNLTFPMSVDDLAKPQNESFLRNSFPLWQSKSIIDEYVRLIQSQGDNLAMPIGSPLCPRLYLVEQCCQYLAWIVPVCMIVLMSFPLLCCKIALP